MLFSKKIPLGHWHLFFPEMIMPLRIMLSGCGHQIISDPDYDWDGLRRGEVEFAVWQYTISGEGVLEYEGETYALTPGSAMLVHIPHRHRYYFPRGGESWEFIYLLFNGVEFMRISRELVGKTGPKHIFDETSLTLDSAYKVIELAAANRILSPQEASALAYQIIMDMLEDLRPSIVPKTKKLEFVEKVTAFCVQHLDEPIGVAELAENANISRYHFSREFKKHSGRSPAAFLRDLRLKKAIHLLQMERLPIKEIAFRCGFDSASYFCRAFQKAFGSSPREFRGNG